MADLIKISELIPDDRNANQGTESGNYALDKSLTEYGAGRSILIDKTGRIIAGNKTAAKFGELGLEDVIVVQTDGSQLVAVQRIDLDLDDPKARALAIADNRVAELNLDWNPEILQALNDEGAINLDDWFNPSDLEDLLADIESDQLDDDEEDDDDLPPPDNGHLIPLAIALTSAEFSEWKIIKEGIGVKDDIKAFLKLMRGD